VNEETVTGKTNRLCRNEGYEQKYNVMGEENGFSLVRFQRFRIELSVQKQRIRGCIQKFPD
jgi:hypothetical protein